MPFLPEEKVKKKRFGHFLQNKPIQLAKHVELAFIISERILSVNPTELSGNHILSYKIGLLLAYLSLAK